MATHNRRYKDSVFVDFFGEDKNAKANFLSLYNALHGTCLDETTELEPLRLEQVMYIGFPQRCRLSRRRKDHRIGRTPIHNQHQYAAPLFAVRRTPLRTHSKPARPLSETSEEDPDAGVLRVL